MTTRHTARDCDERCRGCPTCYRQTGDTVCDRLCPHALPADEDDDPDEEPRT